jgi:imidazole glycerol phosphate synthase glutamine amidotransferase subunit
VLNGEVTVIRTGAANLASVVAAFERLECTVTVTDNALAVRHAKRAVLPGVGAFAPVAELVNGSGLGDSIRHRIDNDLPTLGVCLGLQLLANGSDEGQGAEGLGLLPVRASRFPDSVVVPQLGWNRVEAADGCRFLEDGAAYFANSYRLTEPPPGWITAWSDHGGPFVAAVERGNVLACQFHPELSGTWGRDLLTRWLACGGGGTC